MDMNVGLLLLLSCICIAFILPEVLDSNLYSKSVNEAKNQLLLKAQVFNIHDKRASIHHNTFVLVSGPRTFAPVEKHFTYHDIICIVSLA